MVVAAVARGSKGDGGRSEGETAKDEIIGGSRRA